MGASESRLPIKAGPYKSACVDLMASTYDINYQQYNDHPPLFARIFYPTDEEANDGGVEWMNERDEYLHGIAEHRDAWRYTTRWMFRMLTGHWKTGIKCKATLSKRQEQYPVVVFSHGLSSSRWIHNTTCAALAQQGYVVIAPEHADNSACWTYRFVEKDGNWVEEEFAYRKIQKGEKEFPVRHKQVLQRAAEVISSLRLMRALNEGAVGEKRCETEEFFDFNATFKGHLSFDRPLVAGHSFGGATALTAVALGINEAPEDRFYAAAMIDPWLLPVHRDHYARIRQSGVNLLFLNAGEWQWKENVAAMMKIMEDNQRAQMLTISKAQHCNFADISHVTPHWLDRKRQLRGSIEPTTLCDEMTIEALLDLSKEGHVSETTFDKYAEHWIHGTNVEWQPAQTDDIKAAL